MTVALLPAADRSVVSDQPVLQVVFSDDGKMVAGVCADRNVRLWDAGTGELKHTTPLATGDQRINVAIGSGAKLAAVAGMDGTIRIVRVKDGELLQKLTGHSLRPGAMAFSSDGKLLASGLYEERAVRLWDLSSAKQILTMEDGFGGAADLAFSPQADLLAGSNYDANVRIWNAKTGALVRTIEDLLVSVFSLTFSPDGAYLAGAGVDQTVYIWNTRTWALERKISGQPEMISSMMFSPDGNLLVTGGFDSATVRNPVKVMVWDVRSGTPLRTIASSRRVSSVAFSPDSRMIAVANTEKALSVWDVPQR
jgi:WD40 repeat protein